MNIYNIYHEVFTDDANIGPDLMDEQMAESQLEATWIAGVDLCRDHSIEGEVPYRMDIRVREDDKSCSVACFEHSEAALPIWIAVVTANLKEEDLDQPLNVDGEIASTETVCATHNRLDCGVCC